MSSSNSATPLPSPSTPFPRRRSSFRLNWLTLTSKLSHSPPIEQPLSPSPSTAPSAWSRSSSFSSIRRNSNSSLIPHLSDQQTQQPQGNAISRVVSAPSAPASAPANVTTTTTTSRPSSRPPSRPSTPKGRSAFSSMLTNLSNFSSMPLSDYGGRSGRSASQARPTTESAERSSSRMSTRSLSPFTRRRRPRDPSPHVEALATSDVDSETDSIASSTTNRPRPRNTAFSLSSNDGSGSDGEGSDIDDLTDSSWSEGDAFDKVTERNTETNAQTFPDHAADEVDIIDPLGEGVNVVVPPEPLFPSTLHDTNHNSHRRLNGITRRKTTTRMEHLPHTISRPIFQRDRCTIRLTNGDPTGSSEALERKGRRYVVASDMSIESKYAVEWCIGTVMRDGDEMILVTVTENENKLDPTDGSPVDRVAKLKNQQERQTLAYLLVRQVTSLLQRTHLNVTVVCQAWHAKNSKHLLLDLIDFVEPVMLIVGSRGLGKLKGILLGSTSHYLIQKSPVPVMVARRRLKRPPRRNAHLTSHRARVPLSKAAIDKAPSKVENDVEAMRDEIEREDKDGAEPVEREDDELDPEAAGVAEGSKVA